MVSTHTPALFAEAVHAAAALLKRGEVVALPTETVYGLAANAWNAAAVSRIFQLKGRPAHNPIIVHVADIEGAKQCVAGWPDDAQRLAAAFWPGPLTLVLRRAALIPDVVTAGGDTVGVRWPSHPFIQAVIRECGFPLAAPSANLSNCVSPTNAAHVALQMGAQLPLVVDGGQSQVGIESTVVDLTQTPARVLRPGMIHEDALASVIYLAKEGTHFAARAGDREPLKSPGLLTRHYAPRTPMRILRWRDEAELHAQLPAEALHGTHVLAHSNIPSGRDLARVSVIPHDADAFARALYAELHRCDELGAELIVVEAPPDTPEWRGIRDRLNRAAAA